MIDALPSGTGDRRVAAGCGLRQGEAFGLRVRDIDFLRRRLHVEQQVKLVERARARPAKGRQDPDRPAPRHRRRPSSPNTSAATQPTAVDLVFTSREGNPINRNHFNPYTWKPALVAAGVEPSHAPTACMRSATSTRRVLIDAGESVRAVADYLGHSDPGFTLRVYAHLFPSSDDRARRVVGDVLGGPKGGPELGPLGDPTQSVPKLGSSRTTDLEVAAVQAADAADGVVPTTAEPHGGSTRTSA